MSDPYEYLKTFNALKKKGQRVQTLDVFTKIAKRPEKNCWK